MSKLMNTKHPIIRSILCTVCIGILLAIAWAISLGALKDGFVELLVFVGIAGPALGMLLIYPVILTIMEGYLLISARKIEPVPGWNCGIDFITVCLGSCYSILYVAIAHNATFFADWDMVLSNAAQHSPIYSQSIFTIGIIALVGVIGYLVLQAETLEKMPPLLLVTAIAAMYLGTLESIVWYVQVCKTEMWCDFYLLLFPLNCLMITAKTVYFKMREWKKVSHESINSSKNAFLTKCNQLLEKSEYWPFAAFLLMWPLLGILVALLMLFGQAPDSVIKAWTETSDWNLSQKVSPQNIYYDEHYLCTVAAGGHEKVVKPLRLGVRHGHEVIVNRQLCVANAFEQILEEKTPKFHRVVRNFYDKYGFPVAKLIRSKYIADFIYVLMKPLEWIFLIVIYFCDAHPENRIAVQYTGKRVQDFQ